MKPDGNPLVLAVSVLVVRMHFVTEKEEKDIGVQSVKNSAGINSARGSHKRSGSTQSNPSEKPSGTQSMRVGAARPHLKSGTLKRRVSQDMTVMGTKANASSDEGDDARTDRTDRTDASARGHGTGSIRDLNKARSRLRTHASADSKVSQPAAGLASIGFVFFVPFSFC